MRLLSIALATALLATATAAAAQTASDAQCIVVSNASSSRVVRPPALTRPNVGYSNEPSTSTVNLPVNISSLTPAFHTLMLS